MDKPEFVSKVQRELIQEITKTSTRVVRVNTKEEDNRVKLVDRLSDIANRDSVELELHGFKFCNNFPKVVNRSNWETFKMNWSNFVLELVCKSVEEFNKFLNFPKTDMPVKIGTEVLTPDFHEIQEDGKIITYDFTSSLFPLKAERFKQVVSEKERKYKGTNLTVIYILADQNLPDFLNLGHNLGELYRRVRTLYYNYIIKHRDELDALTKEVSEIYTPVDELLDAFPFQTLTEPEDIEIPIERDYEELKTAILFKMPDMKEFLDNQLTEITNLPDIIMPKLTQQNIYSAHPLNRDLNKSKAGGSYGHSGNLLCPYVAGWDRITIEELLEHDWSNDRNIKGLIKNQLVYRECLSQILEIKRYLALIHSDQSRAIFAVINEQFNIQSDSRDSARKMLVDKIRELIKKWSSKINMSGSDEASKWRITKRGTFKTRDSELTKVLHLANASKKKDSDNEGQLKSEPDFGFFEGKDLEDAMSLFKDLPQVPKVDINLKSAYPFEESSSKLFEQTSEDVLASLTLLESDGFTKHLFVTQRLFRDLVMNIPISEIKYGRTNEFKVIESKATGTVLICTLHPNEKTSGAIKIIQRVPKNVAEFLLKDNMFGRWTPLYSYGDNVVVSSSFFRLNLKFVTQFDSVFGSYLMNQALWWSLHDDFISSPLWKSFYLNYSRQSILIAEVIYTLAMRALGDISFGKEDGKDKFEKLHCKDLRVGTVYKKLKDGFSEMYARLEDFRNTGKWSPMFDCFLGIKLTSLMDYLFIAYTKQQFPKDDGFDDDKFAWGFFKKDVEQQNDWMKNPFNMDVSKGASLKWTLEEAHKRIFLDGNKKWLKVSFCSEFIQTVTAAHYNEIRDKIKGGFLTHTRNILPTEKLPKSKVMAAVGDSSDPVSRLTEGLNSKYPGLASVLLAESVFWTVNNFYEDSEALEEFLTKERTKKREQEDEILLSNVKVNISEPGTGSSISVTLAEDDKSEDKVYIRKTSEPSLLEIAIYNLWKYPALVILVPVNKIQTGWGKRQFYVQTENGRNQNSLLDAGFRPYLSASQYDMILLAGDTKYISLGQDIEKVKDPSFPNKFLVSTEDQSLFGDSYPLEAFDIFYTTMFNVGYLSKPERDFCSMITKTMRGRFHVMPAKSQELIKKFKTMSEKKEILEDFNLSKVMVEMQSVVDFEKIDKKNLLKDTGVFTKALTENFGIRKEVGFALGVMNIVSTCLTVCHLKVVCDIIKDVSPKAEIRAKGHSDDSIKMARLPRVKPDYFRTWDVEKTIDLLTTYKKRKVDFGVDKIYYLSDNGAVVEEEDLRSISCLFICLSLYAPRLVGQRPSLLKWFFGPIGEVLQVVYTRESSIVPLFRYSSSIFKDLPGKSFASDLTNVCSRVLPLIQNGATAQCAVMMQMISNKLTRWRFGIDDTIIKEIRFDQHPVTFGGYVGLPTDYLEFGFDTNTIRLLCSAERNPLLKKQLQTLLMTEEMWNSNLELNAFELAQKTGLMTQNNMEKENTNYGTVTLKEDFERIGDTFMDMEIRFSRNLKTLRVFVKQLKMYERHIEATKNVSAYVLNKGQLGMIQAEMNKPDTVSNTEIGRRKKEVEELKEVFLASSHFYLYKKENFSMKVVRFLDKYTKRTFQESYLRIPLATKFVNRLGYANRLMSNPFNQKAVEDVKKPIMTIMEVALTILQLSTKDNFQAPKENIELYNFMSMIYNTSKNVMLNRRYVFEVKLQEPIQQIENITYLPYKAIVRESFDNRFGYKVNEIVGLLIEVVGRKKSVEASDLMKLEPWLLYDEKFMKGFQILEEFFRKLNVSSKALEMNAPILIRLMAPQAQQIVMKTEDVNLVRGLLQDRAVVGKRLEMISFMSAISTFARFESFSKWDETCGVISRLMFRCVINRVPMVGTHITVAGRRFDIDIQKYMESYLSEKANVTNNDVNAVVGLLSFNKNMSELQFKSFFISGNEAEEQEDIKTMFNILQAFKEVKKIKQFKYLDKYFEGEDREIDETTIKEIVCVSFASEIMICLITVTEKLIIFKSYSSMNYAKLLVKLSLHLSNSTKIKKVSLQNAIAQGSGEYTYSPQKVFVKQRGDRKIIDLEMPDLALMMNVVQNKFSIEKKRGDEIWLKRGVFSFTNIHGEKIDKPYIICPWTFKPYTQEFSFWSGDKMLFRNFMQDEIRQGMARVAIKRIDQRIQGIGGVEFVKKVLTLAMQEAATTSLIFPRRMFEILERFYKVQDEIRIESKMVEIQSLEGKIQMPTPVVVGKENLLTMVDKVIGLLLSEPKGARNEAAALLKDYERKVMIYTLLLLVSTQLDMPLDCLQEKILSVKVKVGRIGGSSEVSIMEYLMKFEKSGERLVKALDLYTKKGLLQPDVQAWRTWLQYIAFYTISPNLSTANEVFVAISNWEVIDDMEPFKRQNVLENLPVLNASNLMMEAFIREISITEDLYYFLIQTNSIFLFPLWRNSYIRRFFSSFLIFGETQTKLQELFEFI